MAEVSSRTRADAIRPLYSDLVRAMKANIESFYDDAFSKSLIENRSSAVDPGDKVREFLSSILGRIETDPSRAPYDDFIAILRKRGLGYLANRIEEELSKENVDLGASHEQPKLIPKEGDSGHSPSQSLSEQSGHGKPFEGSSNPRPPAGNSSSGHDSTRHGIKSSLPSEPSEATRKNGTVRLSRCLSWVQ